MARIWRAKRSRAWRLDGRGVPCQREHRTGEFSLPPRGPPSPRRHGLSQSRGPSYPKALYFRGGRILFGSSNDPKDQLGAILIESGKITQEQLDDVNTKVGPGNPLAKVLAESGFVNQRELCEAARVKVERILSDVISYASGSFEFEDGVLPKGAVDLKLSTEKLLLAAVARSPTAASCSGTSSLA